MSFMTRLFGRGRTKADPTSGVSSPSQWLVGHLGGGPTHAGVSVGPATAMRSPAVLACVQTISEDIARLPPVVYVGTKRGAIREEMPDHPLARLFARRINSWMTPFDFWRFQIQAYLLYGNAYTFIRRNQRGEVIELIPIPPSRVTIYQATDGDLFYSVARGSNHEMAVLADAPLIIPGDYIMHDRGPSFDGITGIPVIAFARESIGLALAAEEHAARTFSNGARPSGVLKHPRALTKETADRLRGQFNDQYVGNSGAMKTILLEEGMDFSAVMMSHAETQFNEGRNHQNEEIARIFGVPGHMIGLQARTGDGTIDTLQRQYVDGTLMRTAERLESLMESRLLTDQEHGRIFIEFDPNRLLRGDMKARFDAYAVGRNWGWLCVNDIRARENMNPAPGGDVFLQPANMVELGKPPPPAPAAAKPGAPSSTAPGTQPAGSEPGAAGTGPRPRPQKGRKKETEL